jgi:hypothetical protein
VHHATPLPMLGEWPALDWGQWKDTAMTLQMYMQIVGKTRLALTPTQNHWWNVPLYVTARGLWTSAMPLTGGRLLDIEFNFIEHALVFRLSTGETRNLKLHAQPVAAFFSAYREVLHKLDADVAIDPMPVETPDPIRFDLDTVHASYDTDAVSRFWHVLRLADTLFKRFSTGFYGKISPVHFFWGSFDLAVTRFSGRQAPPRPGTDSIQAEAYSHEVISAGFWPGNGGYGRAAFYAYAAPVPDGLSGVTLLGKGAFDPELGEFLLDYADVQAAADPAETVLTFLEGTYSAAADLAKWDRDHLERHDHLAQAVRSRGTRIAGEP